MNEPLPAPTAVVLRTDDDALAARSAVFGRTPQARAQALAAALATTPGWQPLSRRAALVVRPEPVPLVAVVGRFEERDHALVHGLSWQVEDAVSRLLPVPYADVEAACAQLAVRLRERLGPDLLRRCTMVGLPRGGLIVAGMLAYCLGLRASQIASSASAVEGPLLVVDDCMISGARTRRWLRSNPGPDVVLAHLHSHPSLRAAAERDDRVRACVGAVDLHDHAPDRHGADYPAWRQRWERRSPDDYWTGHPDHVCYPWNEPDNLIWNAATGESETGWHVVPPSWCLKNRGTDGPERVQVVGTSPGARHVPAGVVWADVGGSTVLVEAGTGDGIALEGTAKDFWAALVTAEDVPQATISVARTYDVSAQAVARDMDGFVASLAERGLWRTE